MRLAAVLGFAIAIASGCAQPVVDNPTEVDTVMIRRAVALSAVSGEILRESSDGQRSPVVSGAVVRPGERILVRRGASFQIGRTRFGPESHDDRWVQFHLI